MSSEDNKKIKELKTLYYFNSMYEEVIGDFLEVIELSERPDFICKKNDGLIVGVELVEIRRGHPNEIIYDQIIYKNITMEPFRVIDLIQSYTSIKEEKRKSIDWKHAERSILIVELTECHLCELSDLLSEELFPDLPDYGFIEIWLVDTTEIEAYGNVELFCLYPSSLWGYYERPLQKPYG